MGDVYPPWQPRLVPLKNQKEATDGDELRMQQRQDEMEELD